MDKYGFLLAPIISALISLLFSYFSRIITNMWNSKMIIIKDKRGNTILEGSEKDIQRQVEELGDDLFIIFQESNTEESKQELKSWKDIGNNSRFLATIDSLKRIISTLIGLEDIWFSLFLIEGGVAKKVYSSRDKGHSNTITVYRIDSNTEFNNLVKGDKYFFSSNMKEFAKDFTYNNANSHWKQEYNSLIVVPITSDGVIRGFFCMQGKNAFKKIDTSDTVLKLMEIAAHTIEALVG